MTRLEFGSPQNFDQAMVRLPLSMHPVADEDVRFVNLAFLRNQLSHLVDLQKSRPDLFNQLDITDRLITIEFESLLHLERISFKREEPEIFNVRHEYLNENTTWSKAYPPQTDDDYGWWDIYSVYPKIDIPDYKLICIMYNRYNGKGFPPKKVTLDRGNWDIKIGIINQAEIDLLVTNLGRHKRH